MSYLQDIGRRARSASLELAKLSENQKNIILEASAEALECNAAAVLKANEADLANAENAGTGGVMLDRLALTGGRIGQMAAGIKKIIDLRDPTGEYVSMRTMPNGLKIGQKRVPFGVIGIIYESRPNVTADAFALCLKSGNAVIFRGGKEALNTNILLVGLFQAVLEKLGHNKHMAQLIEDTDRRTAMEMMRLNEYIDLLIPRGGAGLIRAVTENSTVPVIATGVGNCHLYVDSLADFPMALKILLNGKNRPGVCNALEKLLVHREAAAQFLPVACRALREKGIEVRGDEKVRAIAEWAVEAAEDDWRTEYLDNIIAVKVVGSIDQAISHIGLYGSGHSEAIVTENYGNAQKFLDEVDAAAVYVNASTRFTDGFEFGFGAEIGISTQKLHARGPMGLNELTATKYVIYGTGQIRE